MLTPVASTPHFRRAGRVLTAASLVAIGFLTLLPDAGPPEPLSLCIACGVRGGVDVVLNVLLFVPLGVALALSGVPRRRALLGMAALSACIETIQYFAIAGRDASLGDLLMNTLGGALGYALVTWAPIWVRPSSRAAARLCALWGGLWLVVQVLASFAFAPAFPSTRYYGQLAHTFPRQATFRGAILDARVDDIAVPDHRFADSPTVRQRLQAGAVVSARVIPAGSTPLLAPIVRIADERREEIVLLAQDHESLVFGLRTGAATLRLRPPLFRVAAAFPRATVPARDEAVDTVRISAQYGGDVRLRTERSANVGATRTNERRITMGPELGWTLVLPAQWFLDGGRTERLITLLWVAASLLPLGFWLAHRARQGQPRAAVLAWIIHIICIGGLLAGGFLIVPVHFGFGPSPAETWLAALTGIAAGIGLRGATRGVHAID